MVAHRKQQIERVLHRLESLLDLRAPGDLVQRTGASERFLAARHQLLHGSLAGQQRRRDLGCSESAEQLQHERELRRLGKVWRADREHHAQEVVLDLALLEHRRDGRRQRVLAAQLEVGGELAPRPFATNQIDGAVSRGGDEPRGSVARRALVLPDFQGAAENVLHDVLGQRKVLQAEDSSQRGQDPRRLAAEVELRNHMSNDAMGRISTVPSTSRPGQPRDSSVASSRSRASISR